MWRPVWRSVSYANGWYDVGLALIIFHQPDMWIGERSDMLRLISMLKKHLNVSQIRKVSDSAIQSCSQSPQMRSCYVLLSYVFLTFDVNTTDEISTSFFSIWPNVSTRTRIYKCTTKAGTATKDATSIGLLRSISDERIGHIRRCI
jgi:hypothetical protein